MQVVTCECDYTQTSLQQPRSTSWYQSLHLSETETERESETESESEGETESLVG